MLNVDDVILKNIGRYENLHSFYDPITGEGSSIERVKVLWINESGEECDYYLPKEMLKYQEVFDISEDKRLKKEQYAAIAHQRLSFDYEYYAFLFQKIKPKKTGEGEYKNQTLIPFRLNYAQRTILLPFIMACIIAGIPIRAIIVKARQMGFSTAINGIFEWVQTILMKGHNSIIATTVNSQASKIRGMYTTIAENSPIKSTFSNYEGISNCKYYEERSCTITTCSTQAPENMRGDNLKLAHLSEPGSWKKTKEMSPEDMVQSIMGGIEPEPMTMVIYESTAKGVGNYFHKIYLESKGDGDAYTTLFAPWYLAEKNEMFPEDYEKFVRSWDTYEQWLWREGATIEGICWYRYVLYNEKPFKGDHWRMKSEHPTTADEAFSSTGQKFFNRDTVKRYMSRYEDPLFVGDLSNIHAEDPIKIVKDLRFEEYDKGNLSIWAKPASERWLNRYLATLDVGGANDKADYTVLSIFDRADPNYTLKLAARLRLRGEAWISVYKAMQICTWYQKCLLAPESNYFDNKKKQAYEMQTFELVMDRLSANYSNLYIRPQSEEQIRQGAPTKFGFHMNVKTKPNAYATLAEELDQDLIYEPDKRACMEFEQVERIGGEIKAVEGLKDDITDTDAMAALINKEMPLPRLVSTDTGSIPRGTGMASF